MFTAGYLFNSYDHMTATLNGEVGQEVFQKISDEQGLLPLGAWYLGSREISLSEDRAIKTPEDLNGVNLRMPNSEAWLFLGEALGANPTPMSFSELYLALQTGAVDGQDNPLGSVESAKFYEVQKSITLTHHLVDSVWPVSYTHLDVYKRQGNDSSGCNADFLIAGKYFIRPVFETKFSNAEIIACIRWF